MVMNGAIAGLVAITAEPADLSAGAAIINWCTWWSLVYFSILYFDNKLKLDDPVGAISAHGIVGILGVMVVPFTDGDASFYHTICWCCCYCRIYIFCKLNSNY